MRPLLLLALFVAAGCSKDPQGSDAGTPVDVTDRCDSAAYAKANAECALSLGETRQGYISPVGDSDWYLLTVPELPARPILNVSAWYDAPSTPVVLRVSLFKEDGVSSLATAVDPRSRGGKPETAHLAVRLGGALLAGKYLVLIQHDTAGGEEPAQDKIHPYNLKATVDTDPDVNEPNDEVPTQVALPACGSIDVQGALSVPGDVDKYSFQVTPCAGRTVLFMRLLSVARPQGDILLDYALTGPNGPVSAEHSATPFGEQALMTARLVTAGTYELTVRAYRASTTDPIPPGDVSFTYGVHLELLLDGDGNEGTGGNDMPGTATPVNLSAGGQGKLLTGKLSYVGDLDYYAIQAAGTRPVRLHYKVSSGGGTPRYDVKPGQPHDVTVITTKSTAADCRATCPNGNKIPVTDFCTRSECLWSRRAEDTHVTGYANFEGVVQLPPGESGPFYVRVSYLGAAGAEDRDYLLNLELLADTPDEANAPHTLGNAPSISVPVNQTAYLGHGHGAQSDAGIADNGLPPLPRSGMDYDLSDVDYYDLRFTPLPPPPAPDGGVAPPADDMSMGLSWTIPPAPAQKSGERSYDLGVGLYFCDDATCATPHLAGLMQYINHGTQEWYSGTQVFDGGSPGWEFPVTFDQASGTFTAAGVHCLCLDGKYAAAGRIYLSVQAVNRTSYADDPYTVRLDLSGYPVTATDSKGNTFTCPTPCKNIEKALSGP